MATSFLLSNWYLDVVDPSGTGLIAYQAVQVFLVLGAYFLWYWRRGGQTLAMQTWKLRIVTTDGDPVSLKQGWQRYALAWPSVLSFGIGLWWPLIDRDRQFLHDRLAGTRIILLPASPKA